MTTIDERLDQYIDAVNAGERPVVDGSDPELAELTRTVDHLRSLVEPTWPTTTYPDVLARNLSAQLRMPANGRARMTGDTAGDWPLPTNPWPGEESSVETEAIPAAPGRLRRTAQVAGAVAAAALFALVLVFVFRDAPGGDSSPGVIPPDEPRVWEMLFAAATENPEEGLSGASNIYLTDSRATSLRTLATGAFAVWSPDGSQIVYMGLSGSNAALHVMNPDGSDQRQLTSSDVDEIMPVWSPTGQQIAFLRASPTPDRDAFSLWIINADGSDERLLAEENEGTYFPFTWSPDGSQIVYTRTSDSGQHQVAIVSVASGESRVLVDDPETPHVWLMWSPDGGTIASMSETAEGSGISKINLIDARTGEIEPLAPAETPQTFPAWSPDGRYIAYTGHFQGMQAVYTIEVGREEREPQLIHTEESAGFSWPSWSPDARQIGFIRNQRIVLDSGETQSTFQVAVVDLTDSSLTIIADNLPLMALSPPAWRPTTSSTPVEDPPVTVNPTVAPDPDQSIEVQDPDTESSGIRPPVVSLGDGARQVEGVPGSYGWLDHDSITYASVTTPFIDIEGVDGLSVAPGSNLVLSLQDDVDAPSAITVSVYTWEDNNAIPTSPDGTTGTIPWFVPSVEPEEQTTLAIDDPKVDMPSEPGRYVVEAQVHWPGDERLPDSDNFRIHVTYAFNVYVIDEAARATPVVVDGPVSLTPTVAPVDEQSNLLTIDEALAIVREYLDDPDAQLTGQFDRPHGRPEVWVVHQLPDSDLRGSYRVDRENGGIVEGSNPLALTFHAPANPISEDVAVERAADFMRATIGSTDDLVRIDNQPRGNLPGPHGGDQSYTVAWAEIEPSTGLRRSSAHSVIVNLETGLIYGWLVRKSAYGGPFVPAVTEAEAVEIALAYAVDELEIDDLHITSAGLVEHVRGTEALLVWVVSGDVSGDDRNVVLVWIDAFTGDLVNPWE